MGGWTAFSCAASASGTMGGRRAWRRPGHNRRVRNTSGGQARQVPCEAAQPRAPRPPRHPGTHRAIVSLLTRRVIESTILHLLCFPPAALLHQLDGRATKLDVHRHTISRQRFWIAQTAVVRDVWGVAARRCPDCGLAPGLCEARRWHAAR